MKKTVNYCGNCPFLYSDYDDFAVGYSTVDVCNLSRFLKLEKDCISVYDGFENDEKIETPEWCPLKTESFSFEFKEFSKERLQAIESAKKEIEEYDKFFNMREDEIDYDDPEVIEKTENITKLYTTLNDLYQSEETFNDEDFQNDLNVEIEKIKEQLKNLEDVGSKLQETFNNIGK